MKPRDSAVETVLPLHEERIHLQKREVSQGKVQVQSIVDTVEEVARATLQEDVIEIRRIPVGKTVETPPAIQTVGDLTIVPVLEEVLVVEKQLVLVEEVHIRRSTKTEEVEIPVILRKQRAVIEAKEDDETEAGKQDGQDDL